MTRHLTQNGRLQGEVVDAEAIENLLKGLSQAPLGLTRDDAFRISVAGAQEKTALLRHDGEWLKPHGTTPTTHLIKTQIGQLPGGIDLSDSVENEYYCLKLTEAFGLPVNTATIETFGNTTALVIERFDRRWTKDGRLLRLPQEDCCQALSVPPDTQIPERRRTGHVRCAHPSQWKRYAAEDQEIFVKAQVIFWLIGATDGHAKNFSVFLGPGGSYRMTPLYDILTAQPALNVRQIERKQMKMAMSVGSSRHYRFDQIHGRHFLQTAMQAGLSKKRAMTIIDEVAERAPKALETSHRHFPGTSRWQLLTPSKTPLRRGCAVLSSKTRPDHPKSSIISGISAAAPAAGLLTILPTALWSAP